MKLLIGALLLWGSLAVSVPKLRRSLNDCEIHLTDCEASLSNYSLPLLLYQATFPPPESSSSTVTTASKKDDKKKDNEDDEDLLSKVLGGLLFSMAGDQGPVRNVVYWVNELDDEALNDIFVLLNIPDAAFLPLVELLPPGVLALRAMVQRLYPELELEDLVSIFDMSTEKVESDDVVELLHNVVEDAHLNGTLDDSNLPYLVENLYDMIFELQPRDVAEIITLPFFVAKADDKKKPKDGKPKDHPVKPGKDMIDGTSDGLPFLLGVPVIVLVTRVMVARLLPDLLPSNVLPDFPLIDRLFFSGTEADVFADATMAEVESILVEANITGAEGMFAEDPEGGSAIVDLFLGRAEATVDDFEADPVATTVRVVATSAITSQSVLNQFAPILFSGENDPASTVFSLLDFNATDPEDAATNVREIVQDNYPAIISYGDFFVSVTKNILDTILPGYFTGDEEEQGPIQSLLGSFFESTNSCDVDLTACQASLLLAQGLTRDLNDDDSEPETLEPDMPIVVVAPLPNKNDSSEPADDATESSLPDTEPINMIREQSSSSYYALSAGLLVMAAVAVAI